MIKKITLFIGLFFTVTAFYGQKMGAMIDYKSFATDKLEPYVEFTFLIDGQSVEYVKKKNHLFQAEVAISVDLIQADSIVERLSFILTSQEFQDSLQIGKPDFLTIENVKLSNGDYEMLFTLQDLNSERQPLRYEDFLQLHFEPETISLSAISLLSQIEASEQEHIYNKYGYIMTPLYFGYTPEEMSTLPYMIEIYNSDKVLGKNKLFLVKTFVETFETGESILGQPLYFVEKKSDPVVIFLHQFNIYTLRSGNYNLVVEILHQDSSLIASQKVFFQRSNPSMTFNIFNDQSLNLGQTFVSDMKDEKELRQYISSLFPISLPAEQDFVRTTFKKMPLEKMQRFFYHFWFTRNELDPEGEWKKYKREVDYVQRKYGSKAIKGYQTDRGRVYLKYGKPTSIIEEPYDPQAYPYEIWTYYILANQTNVKFVFANRDLSTNDYELLHSDLIGEVKNSRWQMELTKRLNPNINPDVKVPNEYWGGDRNNNWRLNR